MEPRIQYATTTDGVRIACWSVGSGPAIVEMPLFFGSNIQLEWENDEFRGWFERVGRNRTLVRYDHRGCGLSDRDVADLSLETGVRDLEAVVDKLGVERFALLGMFPTGPVAIAYAARHAERVSHLILWCSYARFADVASAPRVRTARVLRETLVEHDFDLLCEMWGFLLGGSVPGEHHRWFAEYIRKSLLASELQRSAVALRAFDATASLSDVKAPTLILHRRDLQFADVGSNRTLTSTIPDARMVLLEGASFLPYQGDVDRVIQVINEFLGEATNAEAHLDTPAFRTILFTDIEGHTAMMQRLGDVAGRAVLREHERITRDALRAHGGVEVKSGGDGFMASFSSAVGAVECAITTQRAFAAHNEGGSEPIAVRVGLNAGEPIAEDGDYFGAMVIASSRIMAQGRGGEIIASNVVRELCAGKGILFGDRGEVVLRGFDDPVRLYNVSWE